MRQLGKVDSETEVRRIADYLLTLGIKTHVEEEAAGWAIWVYHEDHVEKARAEFAAFLQNPSDSRYHAAAHTAAAVRQEEVRKERRNSRLLIDVRKRWQSPTTFHAPLTVILVATCVSVVLSIGLEADGRNQIVQELSIASPNSVWPQFVEVRHGQVWRLLTPIFLHFGIQHIVFDMWCLIIFGSMVERYCGTWRFLLMVVFIGVTSNLAQYASHGPNFGGMSGVVYGLFGYILMKSRYEPESGLYVSATSVYLMLGWLVLCGSGAVGHVANSAHIMGLAVGLVLGSVRMVWHRMSAR